MVIPHFTQNSNYKFTTHPRDSWRITIPRGPRRRRRGVAAVPQPFRGFMAQRRGVSEVQVPQLPEVPMRDSGVISQGKWWFYGGF